MLRELFWASMRLYKTFPFLQVKCGRPTTCPSLTASFCFFLGGAVHQIIIQPQLFSTLAAISWVQCLYYEGKRSAIVCTSILLFYLALFAGWEVGITYAIRVGNLHLQLSASQRAHSDSLGHRFNRRPLPARVAFVYIRSRY